MGVIVVIVIDESHGLSCLYRSGRTGGLIPGWNIQILPERQTDNTISGPILVRLPLPPGAIRTLHNGDDEFVQTYLNDFPGYFDTKVTENNEHRFCIV